MGSAVTQGGCFADAQESRIQVVKLSEMRIADMKKTSTYWCSGIQFSALETLIYG